MMQDEVKPITEQKQKRRRLKGAKLADLRTLMKRLQRAQNSRSKAREDILDARDLFPDQPNWNNGKVYDANEKIEDRVVIGRLSPAEVSADRRFTREMEQIDSEIGDLLWFCAERLGCMPLDIDPQSGEIKGGPVDGIDPDVMPEPAEDAPAVATCESTPEIEAEIEGRIPFSAT